MHNLPRATLGLVALSVTMPRKRSYQRLIAWLALVALGVAVAMPTVSRALVSPAARSAITAEKGCTAHQRETAPGQDPPPGHGLDACGYCSLVNHHPVVMGAAMAPLRSLLAAPAAARHGDLQVPSPTPPEAHSRGPPLA